MTRSQVLSQAPRTDGGMNAANINGAPLGGYRNKLINAAGFINQRVYSSGDPVSGAGEYTVDRWRVVTSGEALSWTDSEGVRTFTAPAGGVEQVIEGDALRSGKYVLSWEGTATAEVNGVARANGAAFTLIGGANVTVRFSGGTFALPQLEMGDQTTPFDDRHIAQELALCQRYYEKTYMIDVAPGGTINQGALYSIAAASGSDSSARYAAGFFWTFQTRKRVTSPSVEVYSTLTGASGKCEEVGSGDIGAEVANRSDCSANVRPTAAVTEGSRYRYHITVDAELH